MIIAWGSCALVFGAFAFFGTPRRALLYSLFAALSVVLAVLYDDTIYQAVIYPALLQLDPRTKNQIIGLWWVLPDVFFGLLPPLFFVVLHIAYQVLWRPRHIIHSQYGCLTRLALGLGGAVSGGLIYGVLLLTTHLSLQYMVEQAGRATNQSVYDNRQPDFVNAMQTAADGLDVVLRPLSPDMDFVLLAPEIGWQFGIDVPMPPPD